MRAVPVTAWVVVPLIALAASSVALAAVVDVDRSGADRSAAAADPQELAEIQTIRDRLRTRFEERASKGDFSKAEKTRGEQIVIAGRKVEIWQPAAQQQSAAPAPLIVFSHGFHGCSTQSTFLTAALAQHGYIVVAPDHADASCGGNGISAKGNPPEQRFRDPKNWSDATYRERADDIVAVLGGLKVDARWNSRIDWSRVGLMGHSLGGYTVLGLAGGWPSWRLKGVKAVLALSPYCMPFVDHGDLQSLQVAAMYQGGTRDIGVTPSVKKPGGCFDSTGAPVYFVELSKAGHLAWTDLKTEHHDSIAAYSIAFFDKFLAGKDGGDLSTRRADVTALKTK